MRACVLLLAGLGLVLATSQLPDACRCGVAEVDEANDELHSLLSSLSTKTFFRIFQMDLSRECKFWQSNPQCLTGSCSVCECTEDEVPEPWRKEDEETDDPIVDRSLDFAFDDWTQDNTDMWLDQSASGSMTYIDLLKNPESNTGYKGPAAGRVWGAMYSQNCFRGGNMEDMCLEERVFYRVISGLHSATSASIAFDTYESVPEMYAWKLGNFPERIQNIYFTYSFLLRAVSKISDSLRNYDFHTGNQEDDAQVQSLINRLLDNHLMESCSSPRTFDESQLFANGIQEKHFKVNEFKKNFRNISNIIDCVDCEKCRLHAKVQILGLGTAMKILLEDVSDVEHFQRNEISALIVTLYKFSNAVEIINWFESRQVWDVAVKYGVALAATAIAIFLTLYVRSFRAGVKSPPTDDGTTVFKASKQNNKPTVRRRAD